MERSNTCGLKLRRIFRIITLVFCVVFGAWVIVKEAIEPRWVILLGDRLVPGPEPVRMVLGNGLDVHLYEDSRPHIGKIMPLQKGLVLAHGREELIEEGYGFGAPIAIYGGKQYVSRHAIVEAYLSEGRATKRFRMDTWDAWTELLKPKYRPIEPIGEIVFSYHIVGPGIIDIAVDFQRLAVVPELIYLANEQGGQHFDFYSDSDGVNRRLERFADQWRPTTAERTCFTAEGRQVRFCVETAAGQPKYVGRERYNQYRWTGWFWLSWAGTDIELHQPSGIYHYRIVTEMWP